MSELTPEMRYRQAVRKARIISDRELREFVAGERVSLGCSTDLEREFIIAEIGRAYQAGLDARFPIEIAGAEKP